MNALEWNRDLSRPLVEIREREAGQTDKPDRGQGTVSLPEMRRGTSALCWDADRPLHQAPQPLPGWHSPAQAWAQHRANWLGTAKWNNRESWHRSPTSSNSRRTWPSGNPAQPVAPVGYVLSLEGRLDGHPWPSGTGLRLRPARAWPGALRPGHLRAGHGRKRTAWPSGTDLLREMERLGIILDVTHLSDESLDQAMDCLAAPSGPATATAGRWCRATDSSAMSSSSG